jgi:hypothetical protein
LKQIEEYNTSNEDQIKQQLAAALQKQEFMNLLGSLQTLCQLSTSSSTPDSREHAKTEKRQEEKSAQRHHSQRNSQLNLPRRNLSQEERDRLNHIVKQQYEQYFGQKFTDFRQLLIARNLELETKRQISLNWKEIGEQFKISGIQAHETFR